MTFKTKRDRFKTSYVNPPPRRRIQIFLSEEYTEQIEDIASNYPISASELCVQILIDWLEHHKKRVLPAS